MRNHNRSTRRKPPRAMVLIIVVVVVAMISLAGLSFVSVMSIENRAARLQAGQLQLEHVAGSAVELLKAFLAQPRAAQSKAGGALDNPQTFRGVLVLNDENAWGAARFSIVSPRLEGGEAPGLRFGVENESARLNLAVLLDWDQRRPGAAKEALLALPGMTETIADAILDWLDSDSQPRPFGAEADDYQGRGMPYAPRNGVPQCLEELLLVRGVTRQLFLGTDANLNRQIDANERDGLLIDPTASTATLPWSTLLTVSSAERNHSADGQPRIYVNAADLTKLHGQLLRALGQPWADFIVLYRQYGPDSAGGKPTSQDPIKVDLSLPAKYSLESVLDLIDAEVAIPRPDDQPAALVASPLSSQPSALSEHLPKLLDRISTEDASVLYGRINVNLAPREVLLAVPGMDGALAERIVAARGTAATPQAAARDNLAWLLTEGLVDRARLKAILPYLTAGGDVARAQIVAQFDPPGASLRVETAIDATASPPRQVYWKNLRLLGRGYPAQSLGAASDAVEPTQGDLPAQDPWSSAPWAGERTDEPTDGVPGENPLDSSRAVATPPSGA